jgi:hypothetical protein
LSRSEPLRNPALIAELEVAVTHRRYDALYSLLCRLSGLPGPRVNEGFATVFGEAVAKLGPRADILVRELCSIGPTRALAGTDAEFLPIAGVFCLAARLRADPNAKTMSELRLLAEDPRHLVRESVCHALVDVSRDRADALADLLAAWTDGYLGATVVIEALTTRAWLDRASTAEPILARLQEAFELAEGASRSDQRSQGYRALVRVLSEAPAKLIDRFPKPTLVWLEARAATTHVDLREAMSDLAARARARGHGVESLAKVEQALADAAPPRRDPKTYVGPTRKRGSRRR